MDKKLNILLLASKMIIQLSVMLNLTMTPRCENDLIS